MCKTNCSSNDCKQRNEIMKIFLEGINSEPRFSLTTRMTTR